MSSSEIADQSTLNEVQQTQIKHADPATAVDKPAALKKKEKVVQVTYTVSDIFRIPKHLDLENKEQVEDWCVKYNTLNIVLTSGKELEIESEGWLGDYNYKYPASTLIKNADEC